MIKPDTLENQVKTIYLGIGSNLGNWIGNIEKAKLSLFEIEKLWVHPIKRIDIKNLIFSLTNEDIRSIKQIWINAIISNA